MCLRGLWQSSVVVKPWQKNFWHSWKPFIWLSGINDLVVRKSVRVYIYHTDWRRCERVLWLCDLVVWSNREEQLLTHQDPLDKEQWLKRALKKGCGLGVHSVDRGSSRDKRRTWTRKKSGQERKRDTYPSPVKCVYCAKKSGMGDQGIRNQEICRNPGNRKSRNGNPGQDAKYPWLGKLHCSSRSWQQQGWKCNCCLHQGKSSSQMMPTAGWELFVEYVHCSHLARITLQSSPNSPCFLTERAPSFWEGISCCI